MSPVIFSLAVSFLFEIQTRFYDYSLLYSVFKGTQSALGLR